jgi:hypothetical protein
MTITINGSGTITGATTLATTVASPAFTTPNIDSAQIPTVSGTAPLYMCRAWVNFNGTGTVAIRASGNVTSITDNGTGDYTVNFTTAMSDTNYAVFIGKSTDGDQFMGSGTTGPAGPSAYATTSIRIYPQRNSAGTSTDTSIACVSIFR